VKKYLLKIFKNLKTSKTNLKLYVFPVYILYSLIFFSKIFFKDEIIGFGYDWSFPYLASQVVEWGTGYINGWNFAGLGSPISYNTDMVLRFLVSLPAHLGVNGPIIINIFSVLAFSFVGYFAYLLGKKFLKREYSSLLFGMLYMSSPILFNTYITGYLTFLLSYLVFPLLLLFAFKIIDTKKYSLYLSLAFSFVFVLSLSQIQFAVINVLAVGIIMLVHGRAGDWKKYLKYFLTALLFSIIIYLYLLIPLLAYPGELDGIKQTQDNSWISFLRPRFFQVLSFEGVGYSFWSDFFNKNGILFEAVKNLIIFIPATALFVLAYKFQKKSRYIYTFLLLTILGVFLIKGSNPPLGIIGDLLNGTFLSVLFRNTNYYYVILVISLGSLLFICYEYFYLKLKVRYKAIMSLVLLGIVIVFGMPYFSGDFDGNIQTVEFSSETSEIVKKYNSNTEHRTLWLPLIQPFEYKDSNVKGINTLNYPDDMPLFPSSGLSGWQFSSIANEFYSDRILDGDGFSKYLGQMGIKYIVLSKNIDSRIYDYVYHFQDDILKDYNSNAYEDARIDQIDGFSFVYKNSEYVVWENSNYISDYYTLSCDDYLTIDYSSVMYSENENICTKSQEGYFENYVGVKSLKNNIFNMMSDKYVYNATDIFPSSNIGPSSGWVKYWQNGVWWINDGILSRFDSLYSFSSDNRVKGKSITTSSESNRILAEVYFGPRGSVINFIINDQVRTINTYETDGGYRVVDLGSYDNVGEINFSLSSEYGEHAVSRIAILPNDDYDALMGVLSNKSDWKLVSDMKNSGSYSFELLQDQEIEISINSSKWSKIFIDGKELDPIQWDEEQQLLYYTTSLTSGEHIITNPNLYENNSTFIENIKSNNFKIFDLGFWEDHKEDSDQKIINSLVSDDKIVLRDSKVVLDELVIEPKKFYKLSFDASESSFGSHSLNIIEISSKKIISSVLLGNNENTENNIIFSSNMEKIKIEFIPHVSQPVIGEQIIENIKLELLGENQMGEIKISPIEEDDSISQVYTLGEKEKKDSTCYSVGLKDIHNENIVLNQAYDNRWKALYFDESGKKLGEVEDEKHYVANGYANGWSLIDEDIPDSASCIKIVFEPSKIVPVLFYFSISLLVAMFITIMYLFQINRNESLKK